MKQFGIVFSHELRGYLKNKVFVGVTLFLVIAIAVGMFIPTIISSTDDSQAPSANENSPIMLISSEDENLALLVKEYFMIGFQGYRVEIFEGDLEEIKDNITEGKAECAFVLESADSYTYFVNNLSLYDSNTQIADSLLESVYKARVMLDYGLTLEEVNEIMSVSITGKTETLGKNQIDNFFYTYIMIFALYMVILLYGQMVATNVATEKSSRAMELLVTSVKPTSMMFGKVLASCLAGFIQLLLVFGSAILFYNINGESWADIPIVASIFDMPLSLFAYMLVFFVLGFLIYAFLYGAIGSTASKLEDINTSVMPISYVFIIAFMVVVFSMSSGSVDNTAMFICSYIPFTSPMAMFTRICMSTVAWYEIAISIAILVASTVGIGILSAKIYRIGVLLYGTPPKIGNILKMVFKKH